MNRLQASIEGNGCALLERMLDHLVTGSAEEVLISDPLHTQQIRQLLARQRSETSIYYGFPVLIVKKRFVPVCYTEVRLEPGPESDTIRMHREGESLINRRFLVETADLTDAEVSNWARSLSGRVAGGMPLDLRLLLGEAGLASGALLFAADPDTVSRNLLRELTWIEGRSPRDCSPALQVYMGRLKPEREQANTPGITVVRSNPAQDQVLRWRNSALQVVAGPPGTGKTQTIINLIASAVCDQQKVLFVSKNNTAVDNVCDAIRTQQLFPGVLRLGNREVRKAALNQVRQVVAGVGEESQPNADRASLEAESFALGRSIARLEEEMSEVEALQADVAEMAALVRRTDQALRDTTFYRWATDLANHVTAANAHLLHPNHLIGMRRLLARTSRWEQGPIGVWARLLNKLGLLTRIRHRRLRLGLQRLNLPAICVIAPESLRVQCDALLRLGQAFPLLLATARHLTTVAALETRRPIGVIRAERETAIDAKVAQDRKLLRHTWQSIAMQAKARATQLAEIASLADQLADGTADREAWKAWWGRFRFLLELFPVICSTSLSLANAAPNEPGLFDLVILDEASQSDIASFLPALYRSKRACVVGDDQQLRHISNLDPDEDRRIMTEAAVPDHKRLSFHRDSAFDRASHLAGTMNYTLLNRHYRSVPEIINFCNEHFYGGALKVERSGQQQGGSEELPISGFVIDDVTDGHTEYRANSARKSALNNAEAERVVCLVRNYIMAGVTDIGVVTPFRSQRALLEQLLEAAAKGSADQSLADALRRIEVGTIHTFQGGQHQVMLFSTAIAPGGRAGTVSWFDQNRNLINVALSRAQDLLILVCHRRTLVDAGGILQAMVTYAEGLRSSGILPPLSTGVQPERLGLRSSESAILREWLHPTGLEVEVLNGGEQQLYHRLRMRTARHPLDIAPKMRLLDAIGSERMGLLTGPERDYAFRAHIDFVLVETVGFHPIAAVELDGRYHRSDREVQKRDRLKNSICAKMGLPLLRVRWGDWGALDALSPLLSAVPQG